MRSGCFLFCVLLLSLAGLSGPAHAIDFFFEPDTAFGNIGQIIQFSGRIGESPLMRGFTVYMAYDTNRLDLYEPPHAGALIAGQQGLQFNYFDHAPFEPNLLEIGATVFGTDFWQGPGELFTMRMILRSCGDEPIIAPNAPFFVAADETYPPVTYHPAFVRICNAVPQPPNGLTIHPESNPAQINLRWWSVTQDTLGRPLFEAPVYTIYRQQVLPTLDPPLNIATVPDTFFTDPQGAGTEYLYYIITQTGN